MLTDSDTILLIKIKTNALYKNRAKGNEHF